MALIHKNLYSEYKQTDLSDIVLTDDFLAYMIVGVGGEYCPGSRDFLGVILEDHDSGEKVMVVSTEGAIVPAMISENQSIAVGDLLEADQINQGFLCLATPTMVYSPMSVAISLDDVTTGAGETAIIPVQLDNRLVTL
jgi:hypothetical protein